METHFIVVGLLYLCSVSFGEECNKLLLVDTDFPGSDITNLYSADAQHCQHLCTQHPTCQFFSFIRPDCAADNRDFFCFLKSTPTGQPTVRIAKQGLTSGFSLKACNPDPEPCMPEVYHDVDFYGADYRQLFTADYDECQRICTSEPGCRFFTFYTGQSSNVNLRYKCYLKFSFSAIKVSEVKALAPLISGFSHRVQTHNYFSSVCEGKLLPGVDSPGSDITDLPAASAEHCLTLCNSHPLCTFFSYVRSNFKCYLKNNVNVMVKRNNNGITSGLPSRFCQLDNDWVKKPLHGIDIPYSDIRSFAAKDPETCQRTCTEDPNCQYYAFNTAQLRCWHKRVITMPVIPRVYTLQEVVSGFSLRNCHYKHIA